MMRIPKGALSVHFNPIKSVEYADQLWFWGTGS